MTTSTHPIIHTHTAAAVEALASHKSLLQPLEQALAEGDVETSSRLAAEAKTALSEFAARHRTLVATRRRVAELAPPSRVPAVFYRLFVGVDGRGRRVRSVSIKLPDDRRSTELRAAASAAATSGERDLLLAAAAWVAGDADWARLVPEGAGGDNLR